MLMWPNAGGLKRTGPPEGSGDNRHCMWPKTDAMLVPVELSPAIYNALYHLRQDNSALLNTSNEWSGVENSVLPFLRARKYLASLAEALGGSRMALCSFVRFALSHRLMIICTCSQSRSLGVT